MRSSGFGGVEAAEGWLDGAIREYRESGGQPHSGPAYDPLSANEQQRWAVALILKTVKAWVEGQGYRPLRLLVAGVAGTGKSFVIHVVTRLLRQLFRGRPLAQVYCPTGLAAFQVGGRAAHSLFKIPTGSSAHRELAPPSGERLRSLQESLRHAIALIGGERGMMGRTSLGWQEFNASCAPVSGPGDARSPSSWGNRPVVALLGDDLQLPPVMDVAPYNRSHRGPASNHGLTTHDEFDEAVVLTEMMRQSSEDAQLRGLLTRMRTYDATKEDLDWLMSLQVDKQPNKAWIEDSGLYLFSTHKEEQERNHSKLKEVNSPAAPVAAIRAKDSGPHAAKATADAAGGLSERALFCRGARFMLTSGLCQEWGLYNGAIGVVVDVIFKPGERPARHLPAVVLVEFNAYCGPAFLRERPRVVPIVPVERQCDCTCRPRCTRTMIPGQLAWGITFHKSQGLTVGPGCDAQCVVVHPPKTNFEGRCPGGLYVALSRAKTAGKGEYGAPDYVPSALYLPALASMERLAVRVDNETTRARQAQADRIAAIAEETKLRNDGLLDQYEALVRWAQTPLPDEVIDGLLSK